MHKILRIFWKGYVYLCAAVCTIVLLYLAYIAITLLSAPRQYVELPNGARLTPTSRIGDKVVLMAPDGKVVVSPEVVAVQWNAHYVSGLRDFPRPDDPEGRTQEIRFVYRMGDAAAVEQQPENYAAFKKIDAESGLKINTGLTTYTDLIGDSRYVRYDDN